MEMMKKLITRNNILLIGILIIAATLRLYEIEGYMTFLGDEGRDAIVIYDILHGNLTLLGPTASVGGFFMGPFYYYLVAPFFFLFGYSPVGAAVFVAVLSVATVFLIWKIGKDFFGDFAGIIGALLYSISSLVITYSHSSWNPNVMPFFTILTLYLVYKAVLKKNLWLFFIVGVLYGIDIQLHYTELFIGLVIILYVIFTQMEEYGKKYSSISLAILRYGFTIFLGFLVGFSPFLAFEIRHGFPNIKSIFAFIFQSPNTGGDSHFLFTIQDVFFRLFGRLLFNFPTENYEKFYNPQILLTWYLLGNIIAIFCTLLLFYQLWKAFSKKTIQFYRYLLLIVWLGVGVLMFGFYKKQIYDYYFEFMFPLPFLIIGNMLFFLWQKKAIQKVLTVIVITFSIISAYVTSPLHQQPNYQFNQAKEIANAVLAQTNGKPFNFALITGGNSDHAFRYFFKLAKRDPVVIQNFDIDPKRTSVTDQLLIVCDTLPCSPLGHPLWEIAGFGRAEIVGHWRVIVIEIYKLTHL